MVCFANIHKVPKKNIESYQIYKRLNFNPMIFIQDISIRLFNPSSEYEVKYEVKYKVLLWRFDKVAVIAPTNRC